MKKLLTIIALLGVVVCATAQENNDQSVVYINNSGDHVKTTKDGSLNLSIAGMSFEIKDNGELKPTTSYVGSKVDITAYGETFSSSNGTKKRKVDHIAIFELGVNTLSNASYNIYTPEDAAMLPFSRKSVYFAINPITMGVALNKSRSLSFNMALGFAFDYYKFAGKYSMVYDSGVMKPIVLEGDRITKSKLEVSYLHLPFILNWNFSRKGFIAAGINLDVAIGSTLKYKKPRTTVEGELTINPVQVGMTARIGWGKLYGFVNYSFMEMFKPGTGPGGKRLSAGVGLFF